MTRQPSSPGPRQPLFLAALAFAAGVAGGCYCWRPPLWWVVALVVLLAAAAYWARGRPRMAQALVLCATAALGAFSIQVRPAAPVPDLTHLADGRELLVTAHVTHDGVLRGAPAQQRQVVDIETEQIADEDGTHPISAGMRLSVYSRASWTEDDEGGERESPRRFACGERLRFPAKLRLPRNFGNPGALDYRGYLQGQGIVALASARADTIEILPGFNGTRAALWRSRVRRSIVSRIHALWPADEAPLLDAMLIGERSQIGRDTNAQFQRTGAYHILVVSGINVGILAFVVFWILRRVRVGETLATLATIILAIAYAYVADAGAPIVRATLMLAIYLGTRLLYRDRAPLNGVGVAGLGLLAADPRALFDASFQLTFLSVIAIAGIGVPLLERSSLPYRRGLRYLDSASYDFSLPPRVVQFRLDLRMIATRLAPFLPLGRFAQRAARTVTTGASGLILSAYDVLVIAALMQVALALPMAIYFHRATIVGLPANALVVPLTGVLMPAATLAVALGYVWTPMAKIAVLVTAYSLEGITGTVRVLGGLKFADVRVPTPSTLMALAAALAFAFALCTARRNRTLMSAGLTGLIASALLIAAWTPAPQLRPGALEITAIDVGQAESLFLVSPQGRTLLVDTAGHLGPVRSEFDFGEDVISPYLWSRGITRLDAIALTHAHSDHMGGMHAVMANFHPREFWIGPNAHTPALEALLKEAAMAGIRMVRIAGGDRFDFGGAQVDVLWPARNWELAQKPRNNDSLVMRISFGQTSALLTGDTEKKVEHMMAGDERLRVDVLKVAHNGSATSTTPEFLASARPRFAMISVGARNQFGHPRSEVLGRLAQNRVATYRTDTAGAVTFYLDGATVTPKPWVLH